MRYFLTGDCSCEEPTEHEVSQSDYEMAMESYQVTVSPNSWAYTGPDGEVVTGRTMRDETDPVFVEIDPDEYRIPKDGNQYLKLHYEIGRTRVLQSVTGKIRAAERELEESNPFLASVDPAERESRESFYKARVEALTTLYGQIQALTNPWSTP